MNDTTSAANRVRSLIEVGSFEEARSLAQLALRSYPGNLVLWTLIAVIDTELERAERGAGHAPGIAGADAGGVWDEILAHIDVGELDEAGRALRRAADAGVDQAWVVLPLVLERLGRAEEADDAVHRAFRLRLERASWARGEVDRSRRLGESPWVRRYGLIYSDDEDFERALGDWDVPERLWPYMESPTGLFGLAPVIHLGRRWIRDGQPSLEDLRLGLRLGLGLDIGPARPFDFAWIAEEISSVTSLSLGNLHEVEHLELLEGASSLRDLYLPGDDRVLDLSRLLALLEVTIWSQGMLTASQAPQARFVSLNNVVLSPGELRLSPTVTDLTLPLGRVPLEEVLVQVPRLHHLHIESAGNLDLTALRHVPLLRRLTLAGVKQADLSPIGDLQHLTEFLLLRSRSVTGTRALKRNPRLRQLEIYQVKAMDDRDVLLELDLDSFGGEGRLFDADFEDRIVSKPGNWYVVYPGQRSR